MTAKNKRILCVGMCCVDIISVCKTFPEEDKDQRSLDYYWQTGGNAANSATMLSLMGANVEFLGTFVMGLEYPFLRSNFTQHDINTDHCPVLEKGEAPCPIAIIIINQENVTRTIISALNNIAELKYEDFEKIPLNEYQWIHFEGRNEENIGKMLKRVKEYNEKQSVEDKVWTSLELETETRLELVPLIQYTDYAFVSKDYSRTQGFYTKEESVNGFIHKCNPSGSMICAWGEDGAAAKTVSHDHVTSSIFPPEKLVDTLGAGDTFNAATILALSKGKTLCDAITFGCKVAGHKCGNKGYECVKGLQSKLE